MQLAAIIRTESTFSFGDIDAPAELDGLVPAVDVEPAGAVVLLPADLSTLPVISTL